MVDILPSHTDCWRHSTSSTMTVIRWHVFVVGSRVSVRLTQTAYTIYLAYTSINMAMSMSVSSSNLTPVCFNMTSWSPVKYNNTRGRAHNLSRNCRGIFQRRRPTTIRSFSDISRYIHWVSGWRIAATHWRRARKRSQIPCCLLMNCKMTREPVNTANFNLSTQSMYSYGKTPFRQKIKIFF